MTINLRSLRTNSNFWDGAILFICICIGLGLIFIRPKSLYETFFVPVKVSVLNEMFQKIGNIKVYGISPGNAIKVGNAEDNKEIGPIKKLVLSIPKNNIEDVKQVQVVLGDTHFFYTRQQFLQNWKKIDKRFNEEKTIINYINFEAPPEVKTDSVLKKMSFVIPLTSLSINGNSETLNIIKGCIDFFCISILSFILLILLLIFAIFSLKDTAPNKKTFLSMILPERYYNNQRKFGWAHITLVFFSTFAVASFFSRLGIDVLHQGFMLQSSVNLSEGKMLFKEIYFHYGPLTALLQSLAIDVFGKKLIVIQVETALFYALTSIFLWLIWSRLMRPIFATVTCFVWLCMAPYFGAEFLPWSSVYSLFFLTLSLYTFILVIETRNQRCLYLTGMIVSLTFWSKQPVGILLFLSMLSFYFIMHVLQKSNLKVTLKEIGIFLAGNITVSAALLVWLLMNGAIKDWWIQCFTGIAEWAFASGGWGIAYQAVWAVKDFFPYNFWTLFPLFAFLTLASVATNIGHKEKIDKQTQILLIILFVSLANWLNYFPVPCYRHYYWAATPLVGIFAFCLLCSWKLVVKLLKLNKIVLSFGLALLMLLSITIVSHEIIKKIEYGIKRYADYRYEVTKPDILSGMMVTHKSQVAALEKLDTAIQTYRTDFPGTSLISLSNLNFLFLTLIDNNKLFSPLPTPTEIKILLRTYEYEKKLSKCIEEKKVLIFVDEPKTFSGYRELAHISTMPISPYDFGTWYLYAPIKTTNMKNEL
jgi:hypothetical protein